MCDRIHAKYSLFLSDFNKTWNFSTDFFWKYSYTKFDENPWIRVVLCGQTDGQTERNDEANSRFSCKFADLTKDVSYHLLSWLKDNYRMKWPFPFYVSKFLEMSWHLWCWVHSVMKSYTDIIAYIKHSQTNDMCKGAQLLISQWQGCFHTNYFSVGLNTHNRPITVQLWL